MAEQLKADIARVGEQEKRLVLPEFTLDTAWALGCRYVPRVYVFSIHSYMRKLYVCCRSRP